MQTALNIIASVAILYAVFQLFFLFFASISRFNSEMWELVEEKDQDGLINLKITDSWVEWIILPVPMTFLVLKKKSYLRYRAEEDAKQAVYNNTFRDNKYQQLYDDVYLAQRKKIIVKLVEDDINNKVTKRTLSNPSEHAFYQSEYLTKVSKNDSITEMLKNRKEKIDNKISSSTPVDNETFVSILKKVS